MPPKSTQRSKAALQSSTQAAVLTNTVKKFCEEIGREKKVNIQMKASESLNPLKEIFRTHKKSGAKINATLVRDIVTQLDNAGNNLCSRLDPTLFSIIVEGILQSEGCREGERGLYLLADSLSHDSRKSSNKRSLEKRKDHIGKECFQLLMNYFLDIDNDVGTRKWVGILCSQLLNGSKENRDKLELGSDDLRQRIGPLMVEERNELIRLICGQLVRDLKQAGVPLRSLFPIDYERKLYDDFPESSQGGKNWAVLFDEYVDDVVKATNQSQPAGEWHFAYGIFLEPVFDFGVEDNHVNILITGTEMSIMAPSSEKKMEQLLDIPLRSIRHMTVSRQAHSQNKDFAYAIIELENDNNTFCYLDAAPTKLAQIHMSAEIDSIIALKELFVVSSPEFRVTEEHDEQGLAALESDEKIPRSTLISKAEDDIPTRASRHKDQSERVSVSQSQETIELDRKGEQGVRFPSKADSKTMSNRQISPKETPHLLQGPQESVDSRQCDVFEDENPSANEPAQPSAKLGFSETAKSATTQAGPPKKWQGVKPKAKVPIIASQRKANLEESRTKITAAASASTSQQYSGESSSVHATKKAMPRKELSKSVTSSYHLTRPRSTLIDDDMKSSQPIRQAKSTTAGSKQSTQIQATASQPKQIPHFENDYSITAPGDNDASKPKTKADKTLKKAVADTAKVAKSRSQQLKDELSEAAASQPKRYGLYNKSLDNERIQSSRVSDNGDIFDIPVDNEADVSMTQATKKKGKSITKITSKSRNSTGTVTSKIASTTASKAVDKKKRLSAPAKLAKASAPSRNSQRVAAAKANAKMQGAVETEVDLEPEEEESKVPRAPQAPENLTKKVAGRKDIKAQSVSQKLQAKAMIIISSEPLESVNSPEEQSLLQLQQEDAISLGFTEEDTAIDANHKVKTTSFLAAQPKFKPSKQNRFEDASAKTKDATIKMANKLDSLLDLEEDPLVQVHPTRQVVSPQEPEEGATPHNYNDGKPTIDIVSSSPAKLDQAEDKTSITVECPAQNSQSDRFTKAKAGEQKDQFNDAQEEAADHQGAKRSSVIEDANPSKKRRSNGITRKTEKSPVRRSPRLVAKSLQAKPKASKTTSHENLQGFPMPEPPTAVPSDKKTCDSALVDDHLVRKQQVISFDSHGPRNQGVSSTNKRSVMQPREFEEQKEKNFPVDDQQLDLKRKRNISELVDIQNLEASPPRKRLSISPPQNYDEISNGGDEEQTCNSSPPIWLSELGPLRARGRRQSSQVSRVDINGSPIASPSIPKIDHISKLKKKLSAGSDQLRIETLHKEAPDNKTENKARRLSEVFGPKVSLGSQPKARPSSPSEVSDRYIAHKRTGNGHYEEVSTREVVEEQIALADPFQDEGRKSSRLTNLLQDEKDTKDRKYKCHTKRVPQEESEKAVVNEAKPPELHDESLVAHSKKIQARQVWKTTHRASSGDKGRTLVNSEKSRHVYQQSLPSDMTSDSTESSQPSRTPLQEKIAPNDVWNVAIRPHYSILSEAVHRIANEVILQLAGEEDKMDLLVETYNDTGAKVLGAFESRREEEKSSALKKLERKKTEMMRMYTDAKEYVQETAESSTQVSVVSYEKEWRKQQAVAQEKISEGMDMLE